ncbi:hypothetical protein MUP46_04340 [Patescibacteria group bacterium]|nr:hypothetical protein [Patescibacteria group bacterium]
MKKNISILCPESDFTSEQLQKLEFTGKVSFLDSKSNSSLKSMIRLSKNADILAFSPESLGKSVSKYLFEILKASPNVKALVLNSTNTDCVDMNYCSERNISVSVIHESAIEATAELVVLVLLGCSRNIFTNGWRAQKKMYQQDLGFELAGKTLGIIGLNAVSERLIQLAKPFGMRIFFCDNTFTRIEGAERKSLEGVLYSSDILFVNLPETEANKEFLSKERIGRIKQKACIVNLSGQGLVDKKAMAQALENGRIGQYVFETERLKPSPLANIEHAIAFKPLSKHTRESLNRGKNAWVKNIADLTGKYTS